MIEIFKKLQGKRVTITGCHPDGTEYDYGKGVISQWWEPVDNVVGFSFMPDIGGGWVWPGIDSVDLEDGDYFLRYTNTIKQEGFARVSLI